MERDKFLEQGRAFGLSGSELKAYVDECVKEARDERAAARAAESESKDREAQLLVQQIRLEELRRENNSTGNLRAAPKISIPPLPPFQDGKDDIDSYLCRFERHASSVGWDTEEWALALSALLTGKALQIISRLTATEARNYVSVKTALLKGYDLTEEGYRLKFRHAKIQHGESYIQFACRIEKYLDRWLELSPYSNSSEGIKNLVLQEQIFDTCNKELIMFIKERQPSSLQNLLVLADQYRDAHSDPRIRRMKDRQSTGAQQSIVSSSKGHGSHNSKPVPETSPKKEKECYSCKKVGHLSWNCPLKKRQEKGASMRFVQPDSEPAEVVTNRDESRSTVDHEGMCIITNESPVIERNLTEDRMGVRLAGGDVLPLLSAAACGMQPRGMPVCKGIVNGVLVDMLRDTGCSTVVVRRDLVREEQLYKEEKICVLIDRTVRSFQVAKLEIDTPYYTGEVEALCVKNPVYDLVLGQVSGVRKSDDPNPDWTPKYQHVNAVETRGQKRRATRATPPLQVPKPFNDTLTVDDLIQAQAEDVSLSSSRKFAETEEKKTSRQGNTSRFFYKKGILYREYVDSQPGTDTYLQIVVPVKFRQQVLKLAHESILGGHLGVKKTTEKILMHFFWPGMHADVVRHCRSCEPCQRTMPKGKVSKVPLGSTPLIDEPFRRIAMDLIGPIEPVTTKGNRFILTVVDYATRYPEAVALRRIDTQTVAEALVDIYSRVGIPREVLTDKGGQFTSELMKEVSRLLSIRQMTTTPYHPACNGLVERFNGTLKSMLRKMCEERPKDWDRYLNPLLFAYRESVQESTGFSPFELLYGRVVRGPLAILQELWTGGAVEADTKTTYQYVLDLKDRLEATCRVAQENLSKAAEKYRKQYNKKAKMRKFDVGDEVLLLLPTDHNKLLMQWRGPYKVTGKVGKMDYRLDMDGKTKTFHANLLKKFFRREEQVGVLDAACTSVVDDDMEEEDEEDDEKSAAPRDLLQLPSLTPSETLGDVQVSPHLNPDQQDQINALLHEFQDIMTDLPGCTNLGKHDIKLTDKEPIKCRPYPLPHALREEVKNEVQKMINLDIVETSSSPYASPVVMVRKKDGSVRFCCDYRKLNQVTVADAEPIPDQEEIFSKLARDKYFSKIDLTKGYWQVPLTDEAKPLTAFITPDGLYQFKAMPFGLVNAPASFSRIMRDLLRGIDKVDNFIDDILIHTATFQEHLVTLRKVFEQLKSAGLTVRPTKCVIGCEDVEFLGHRIGHGELRPVQSKVEAIQEARRPKTKKQLRSFLGLVGYYRRFVPNFAALAAPLTDKTKKGEPPQVKWDTAEEMAFNTLKQKLAQEPILHLPDLTQPFILRTDASDVGLGAILLQDHDGKRFPVAYASRKLLPREQRYAVMERECLAVVWGIRKFEPYLFGKHFQLETDHQPLKCIAKSKVANGRILRWALALQPYRFSITAIKSSENVGADYLSRIPDP